MIRAATTLTAIALTLSVPAIALAGELVVQAVQVGTEAIRYNQGVPTLDLALNRGAVQVVPLGKDHGSYVFGIAVYNSATVPANFDVSNVSVQVGSQQVSLFTVDQLVSKAKSRATWAQIGTIVATGVGSALSSSQRNHYRSTYRAPGYTSHYTLSTPSLAGQLRSQRIEENGGLALGRIQARLDETRERLGDEIIQMTTIEPGGSYAGKIVLNKIKPSALPQRVDLVVNWNGEAYPFSFQIAPSGTPAPTFTMYARPQLPEPAQPSAIAAVLRSDEAELAATQQVAFKSDHVQNANSYAPGPAYTPAYTRQAVTYSGVSASYAKTPRFGPGGTVEVPYQAASWASTIDPITGFVVPVNPPSGPQVIFGG